MEGDFRLIWPLPLGLDSISSSSSNEAQMTLAKMLNNFDGDQNYVFKGWNTNFTNKIKKFKKSFGLSVDGKVGVDTLWALLPYTETEHPLFCEKILTKKEEDNYLNKLKKVNAKNDLLNKTNSDTNSDINSDDLLNNDSDEPISAKNDNSTESQSSSPANAEIIENEIDLEDL